MVRLRAWSLLATLLATPTLALTLTHCSSNDGEASEPDSVATGKYQGLLTGTTETGVLAVTVAKPSSTQSARPQATAGSGASVSGTITLVSGGDPIELTGSYDAVAGTLTLTGTSPTGAYSLTGKSSAGAFEGTYTSPGDAGNFSLLPATSSEVTLYCGTYDGDSSGVWNLVVDASGRALGSHCDASECGALTGTVTDDTIELRDPKDPSAVATGTTSGDTVSGTWQGQKASSGTWQGSVDDCGSATSNDGVGGAGGAPGAGGAASGEAGAGGQAGMGGAAGETPTLATVVTGLTDSFALSADDDFVYFFTSGEVHRCPVAGCTSGLGEKLAGPLAVPSSLATSGSALFFTHDFHLIDTCAVSASPGCTATTFLDVGPNTYPAHLRVDGDNLYWVSEAGNARKVQMCPTAGCSSPTTILDSADAPLFSGVAVAGLLLTSTNLYIASFTGGILRFDMSDPETVDAASGVQAAGSNYGTGELAIDGTSLFWGEINDGRVRTCETPACSSATDYLTGLSSPAGVSISAPGIFVAERGTSAGANAWAAGTGAIRVVRR
jgi:hypothetical protein